MTLSLLVGGLGMAAHADDTSPTTPSDPSTATETTQPSDQSDRSLTTAVGALTANPDTLVIKRGRTTSINVKSNDVCNGATCTIAINFVPTGWTVIANPTSGVVTVTVPARTTPRRYSVTYTLSNATSETSHAALAVLVTPDAYNAPAGMLFSHPFRSAYHFRIRSHIVHTIDSVPPGGQIRIASWSFASPSYYRSLWNAKRRGVSVQIVLSNRNSGWNSDYPRLKRIIGTNVTSTGSWVKRCTYSCRGRNGTMHSKIYLFSQSYRTPWVTMTGSANLTDFAVDSQWNQINTVSNSKPVYDGAMRIFNEMVRDRPASPMYVENHYPGLWAYFYPSGAPSISSDFMMRALAPVKCSGAVNAGKGGHTIIKIAMYAWYQQRGTWLAKRVRQLWSRGCQIQIVYGISSNPVKKILYSPAGRGRIPMRQIMLTNKAGDPIYYLHDKWVTITGNYAGVPNNSVSFQGSFNFSDIGFRSDENFQRISGRAAYNRFARDFTLLWTDRQARAPSPTSTITNVERTAPAEPTLGTGAYRYMETD
jgi:hypothetical protein